MLKLRPEELVGLWNATGDLPKINDSMSADLRAAIKRFRVYARAEVVFFNQLAADERLAIKDDYVEIPAIKRLDPKHFPENVPADMWEDILPLFTRPPEDRQKPSIQLAQLLESKNKTP